MMVCFVISGFVISGFGKGDMELTSHDRKMVFGSHRSQYLGLSLWEDGSIFINFHVDFTFRCNGGCRDCMKLLGLVPRNSLDSDLSIDHIKKIARILNEHKIRLRRLRISGGEPLLHPQFVTLFRMIEKFWKPIVIRVYTNNTIPFPPGINHSTTTMRPLSIDQKEIKHRPFYISPVDIGIEPKQGFLNACKMSAECGRSVNAFGFTPCMQYPHIGRILGKDVHSSRPMLLGDLEICQHCICSLTKREQRKIRLKVADGTIDYPTKTYREGIAREREQPTTMKLLLER